MSLRSRIVDWTTAVVVAIGVVASIPMIPILLIGWLVVSVRAGPAAGVSAIGATRAAADDAAPGRLEGFNGSLLFPMVIAGWFLIAILAAGFVASDPARPEGVNTTLALLLFAGLLVGPTLLAYRSMYPAMPLDEWLGGRDLDRVGRWGVALATTFAVCWLVWSITTWTTFLGGLWTTFCMFVLVSLVITLPVILILIGFKGGRRLYLFIGVAIVVGIISVGVYNAGLTPAPRWP